MSAPPAPPPAAAPLRVLHEDAHLIALDKPATGWDSNLGYGLIDAYAAALLARSAPPTRTADAP